MKKQLLKTLRDRTIPTEPFRKTSNALAKVLIDDLKKKLDEQKVQPESVIIVCILRSSIVFLPAAMEAFPVAPVAVVGIKRDEETAEPHCYYENTPPVCEDSIIIIPDPMLATGGTAAYMVGRLIEQGAKANNIHFLGFIAAREGVEKLSGLIPRENIAIVSVDERLDNKKFIVPGLGDFGDRYFGYGHDV